MEQRPFIHRRPDTSQEELDEEWKKALKFVDQLISPLKKELLEKDAEMREVVRQTIEQAQQVALFYGGKEVSFSVDQVHLLASGAFQRTPDFRGQNYAFCDFFKEGIYIERLGSPRMQSRLLFHELSHLFSYKSLRLHDKSDLPVRLWPHRFGLSAMVGGGKKRLLDNLEEAITVDLEKRYADELETSAPAFLYSSPQDERIKQRLDQVRFWHPAWLSFIDRLTEIDPLLEKEDIRTWFYRAHYTGNLLPLARKIERILGRGSFLEFARQDLNPIEEADSDEA